jgi:histidyl-tRNA synthetase
MGSNNPEADAEILILTGDLMKSVGLENVVFKVSHVGVLRGIMTSEDVDDKAQNKIMQLMDKKRYEDTFKLIEKTGASQKCLDTFKNLVKLKGQDFLEVLAKIREYVKDYDEALVAVENLKEILTLFSDSGCKIDVDVEAGFARGLEYYTGMIFEAYVPELNIALGGGGRYDKLIELFGGEPTPAVGVAHGLDRIMLAMQKQKAMLELKEEKKAMIIPAKEKLKGTALKISQALREAGITVEVEVMGRKMAKALEDADRRGMDYAIIVGERELKENAVVVRDLKKRKQSTVKIENIVKAIKT